jgi:hypothetical protein
VSPVLTPEEASRHPMFNPQALAGNAGAAIDSHNQDNRDDPVRHDTPDHGQASPTASPFQRPGRPFDYGPWD